MLDVMVAVAAGALTWALTNLARKFGTEVRENRRRAAREWVFRLLMGLEEEFRGEKRGPGRLDIARLAVGNRFRPRALRRLFGTSRPEEVVHQVLASQIRPPKPNH